MKPVTVILIAAAALSALGGYLYFGNDEQPAPNKEAAIEKNVDGLFGKITSQTAGSSELVNVPAPANAGKLVSFESESNLYQFYSQAKESSNPAMVYQAYRAYASCQSLLANAVNLRAAIINANGGQAPLSQERQKAIEEILRRCQGFERLSEREIQEIGNTLREKTKRMGSAEARLDGTEPEPPIDRDMMIALLQSNSTSAYERATPIFANMIKASMQISPDTSDGQHVDIAVLLAACDLGRDCTENAWHVLMQCAYDNYCQKPLAFTWQENLTDADKKHVMEIKANVLKMIKTNNFTSLK